MRFQVLATDYDGTLAHHGRIDAPTLEALERFRRSGRRLVLVTGRVLDEILAICPRIDLFDRVVAENGALLYRPEDGEEEVLAEPPPAAFVARLRALGVAPLSEGRVIVATLDTQRSVVVDTIRALGLELQIIENKESVMVLPAGVDKATGLSRALAELGLSQQSAVGVGDAENDQTFLAACGCAVAVANAVPQLKARADLVTRDPRGAGVVELIERVLAEERGC